MRSIQAPEKWLRAFPKSSDASPITSLANKQGKQTTKTLNLALRHEFGWGSKLRNSKLGLASPSFG